MAIKTCMKTLCKLSAAAVLTLAAGLPAQTPSNTVASPDLAGIAHVAFRVADLDASVKFYETLGYEKPFELSRDGKVYEAFLKVNDHQFIELYPVDQKSTQVTFMHICFEGHDLAAVRAFYVQHGLQPTEVVKAGAGNLLFSMRGPATPTGPQVIEYTQYMPGSMHSKDVGQHLGKSRLSTKMVSVSLPFDDPSAARSLYVDHAGFVAVSQSRLLIPGAKGESISVTPAKEQGFAGKITFAVENLSETKASMKKRGLHPVNEEGGLKLLDPDGNVLIFLSH